MVLWWLGGGEGLDQWGDRIYAWPWYTYLQYENGKAYAYELGEFYYYLSSTRQKYKKKEYKPGVFRKPKNTL